MPGDDWQRFANLRALLAYQWMFPGKKLLFMGGEFGQSSEWNANADLEWWLLEAGPYHRGVQRMVEDLNKLYASTSALWESDYDHDGFSWIDCSDQESSILSFVRKNPASKSLIVVVLNLTPVVRYKYRVGLPRQGKWREVLNTDAAIYGGSNVGNMGGVVAEKVKWHNHEWSAQFTLAALSVMAFEHEPTAEPEPAAETPPPS
jgi:1,4-alpha-glucan branching enzyme